MITTRLFPIKSLGMRLEYAYPTHADTDTVTLRNSTSIVVTQTRLTPLASHEMIFHTFRAVNSSSSFDTAATKYVVIVISSVGPQELTCTLLLLNYKNLFHWNHRYKAYTHKGGVSSNSWFIIINVPCSLLEGHHSCLAHNCHTSVLQHLLHTDIARLLHRTCRHLDNHNLINKRIALAQDHLSLLTLCILFHWCNAVLVRSYRYRQNSTPHRLVSTLDLSWAQFANCLITSLQLQPTIN